MPLFTEEDTMVNHNIGGSNFGFSATRIDGLGATEYTLVTIAVDVTGSAEDYADELRDMLITAVDACKKSPRSDNLLIRVVTFSTHVGGVYEIHGFKHLSDINTSDYPRFDPKGLTPLYDATYSSVGAMIEFGGKLMEDEFLCNAIGFVITDGYDNESTTTPAMIKKMVAESRKEEKLESLITILIGVNAAKYRQWLETFRTEADITQYIDAGDVTKGKLAKLADFVSQSVSSQSQALGTGGPSQNISATI